METLIQGVIGTDQEPGRVVMVPTGGLLIYLGTEREYEPTLSVPVGLGTILVNFPNFDVLSVDGEPGPFNVSFDFGVKTGLLPLLLFIRIGAMTNFGPLLQNLFMLMFGAAAQLGIFLTVTMVVLLGSDLNDAVSIGIIGTIDGPASISATSTLHSKYIRAIIAAAHSHMALVPVIQPVAIKIVTTETKHHTRMIYQANEVSQIAEVLFPVVITIVAGLIAPVPLPLVGFLMFGSLLRECGVLDRLPITTQSELVNIISILLGLSVSASMNYAEFLKVNALMVIGLGLAIFVMDSVGGVLLARFLNLFRKERINPMVGAAGVSAFLISDRVIQKMATGENPQNFILMHATSANVSEQITSVIAGGLLLAFLI